MITLNDRDFKFSINSKPRIINRNTTGKQGIIMVGVSWCGYCKEANPEFRASAEMLEGKKLFFAYVDGDRNPDLLEKIGVKSFPTFLFIDKNGFVSDVYKGERSKYAFNQYICIRTRQCRT